MPAREGSKTLARTLSYFFGVFSLWLGVSILNWEHPYGTGLVCLGFFVIGVFFLSVVQVRLEGSEIKYRRWSRWHAIHYREVQKCGELWMYGFIRPRHYAFPWGRIYFARPFASDSFLRWDKETISTIRSKARI